MEMCVDVETFQKERGGPRCQVGLIRRHCGMIARQPDRRERTTGPAAVDVRRRETQDQRVEKGHRAHQTVKVVISVRPSSRDVEKEIDLGG